MTIRTWHAEALVVALVLAAVSVATGGALVQWLSAAAVLASFMHAQVSDRMAQQQATAEIASVECWRWSGRYFVAKEMLWCAVFVLAEAWPALAGVVLFLGYSLWRRLYRGARA